MKTLLIALICLGTTLLGDANTDWVDARIEAIKPPRQGVEYRAVDRVKDPFIFVYSSEGKTKGGAVSRSRSAQRTSRMPLKLTAVMNRSALINGKWYKTDDKVRGYTLSRIHPDFVILTRDRAQKRLYIATESRKIKIQVK